MFFLPWFIVSIWRTETSCTLRALHFASESNQEKATYVRRTIGWMDGSETQKRVDASFLLFRFLDDRFSFFFLRGRL